MFGPGVADGGVAGIAQPDGRTIAVKLVWCEPGSTENEEDAQSLFDPRSAIRVLVTRISASNKGTFL
jgi:hypothetical protein